MQRMAKLVFALELIVVMVGSYLIAGIYEESMKDYHKITSFPYEGIYFSTFHDHTDGSFEKVRKQVEAHPKFRGWSFTEEKLVDNQDAVISFDRLSSQLFSMDVKAGKYFTEVTEGGSAVPCVIVDNGKNDADVGDKITIDGIGYVVTGILPADELYFNIMGTYGNGTAYTLSDLKAAFLPADYRTILCSSDKTGKHRDQTSAIAYFDRTMSAEEMKEIEGILQKEGVTETFGQLKDVTYQECYYKVMEYIPFCAILLFASLVGMITLTVINSGRILRRYGIFALSGCRQRWMFWQYWKRLFVLSFFTAVVAAGYAWHIGMFYWQTAWLDLVLCAVYSLCGMLTLRLLKGRKNILACMKG